MPAGLRAKSCYIKPCSVCCGTIDRGFGCSSTRLEHRCEGNGHKSPEGCPTGDVSGAQHWRRQWWACSDWRFQRCDHTECLSGTSVYIYVCTWNVGKQLLSAYARLWRFECVAEYESLRQYDGL